MDLKSLIETHLDLARLSKDLDELGHGARVWSVEQWTRANMTVLWDATKGFRPVTLDDFVSPSLGPLTEVIHHGKNSLALFNSFQKHFCRPGKTEGGSEGTDILIGLNQQSMSVFTGPGYYVAHPSAEAGEIDIDYTMSPPNKPDAWPKIVPNSERLGRFVYHGMVDVMRGISSHVTIGRTKKKGSWMDVWFVLVREDPKPAS